MACRACNQAKGNQSYEGFLAEPRRLKPAFKPKRKIVDPAKRTDKLPEWSMAAAIARGDITENGERRKPKAKKPEPKKPPAQRMTALEAAVWLRVMHEQKGKPWPLA